MAEKWDKGTGDDALMAHVSMSIEADDDCIVGVQFDMPLDIKNALTKADFDQVEEKCTADAKRCWLRGFLMGYRKEDLRAIIANRMAFAVPDALYRMFVHRQVRVGNEAWEVPTESMRQMA